MKLAVPLLLLGGVLAAAEPTRQEARPESEGPRYPYVVLPIDQIRGHLMEGEFREPGGVFFEPEHRELYVADMKNALIGIFNEKCVPVYAFGEGETLLEPTQVVARPDGTIYVLDNDRSRIKAFDYRGGALPPVLFPPEGDEALRIEAFAMDTEGRWYVADSVSQRLLVYTPDLELDLVLPRADDVGHFESIAGLAVSPSGLIAVIDRRATPVQIFDRRGFFAYGFGTHEIGIENFTAPRAVAFDEDEYVYVVDMLRHDVKIFTVEGEFQGVFGGWFGPETRGRAPGEMLYPASIAIAPGGWIYVAERFGNRVQAFERHPRGEPIPRRVETR